MEKIWGIVELLRHARHDWLNKIQLIKGNIELGKIDDVKDIIDAMIMEAQNEAELSNLQIPKMAGLLLTSKWSNYPFVFDYEILHAVKGCNSLDEKMYNWTVEFVEVLCQAVEPFASNELKLSIFQSKETMRFTIDFEGMIKNKSSLENFLQKDYSKALFNMISFTDNEIIFDIGWSCENSKIAT